MSTKIEWGAPPPVVRRTRTGWYESAKERPGEWVSAEYKGTNSANATACRLRKLGFRTALRGKRVYVMWPAAAVTAQVTP